MAVFMMGWTADSYGSMTISCHSEGHSYGILRIALPEGNMMSCCQCCGIEEQFNSSSAVDAIVRRNEFQQRYTRNAGPWQVVVYERHADAEAAHT